MLSEFIRAEYAHQRQFRLATAVIDGLKKAGLQAA
jgi:hypothetical protein